MRMSPHTKLYKPPSFNSAKLWFASFPFQSISWLQSKWLELIHFEVVFIGCIQTVN